MSVSWDYYDDYSGLIDDYMPSQGEGDTVASQLVTAVNKIIYKWYNDGDVYDNTYHLQGWWNDLSSYANWIYNHCGRSIIKRILISISACETEDDYEDLLKDLADNCLNREYLEQLAAVPKEGSIYDASGPFRYEEPEEDDDYDEDDYPYEDEYDEDDDNY